MIIMNKKILIKNNFRFEQMNHEMEMIRLTHDEEVAQQEEEYE